MTSKSLTRCVFRCRRCAAVSYVACNQMGEYAGIVIGPGPTLDPWPATVSGRKPDACILDIRLEQHTRYPLADEIPDLKVPFVFASGESK